MKRVHTAANLPEAHLLLHLLAHRGIRARVFNANASSLAGELPIDSSLPQLWVEHARDAGRAAALIEGFLRSSLTGPGLKCAACGEENPPAFELCWNCGAGLEHAMPLGG